MPKALVYMILMALVHVCLQELNAKVLLLTNPDLINIQNQIQLKH